MIDRRHDGKISSGETKTGENNTGGNNTGRSNVGVINKSELTDPTLVRRHHRLQVASLSIAIKVSVDRSAIALNVY